ncbi:amino acid ABC transporter permease [Bifidobacterium subtile]|jgi:polar amino acid transport system permease protein/cystine transport system permease protein|uniref:Amino acid ABC transporter permease YckA1 n=1 Tax=Bifidobacterium subtile TaxID=77635 RepID=A0A087E570_9BIFI|nr:amino acid ABC transporter permease [Bifidobacterium subtile]KFJ02921.1 amino acid ABC transporter permease YckA1 [Bifidobacterium subtile]MCI1223526.1 amino acid ABC transporter permease [Bifidobacterium subtile]MCI1242000.1 amino acid ABC transporter permease [Bifidobacterium subtile]MCI1258705.1 amino acid ABC transporter permease [Bifidobacterium subtile]QOL36531.1 amino acid ABC transporter permease [Bifidobacterium subtile]
MEPVLVVLRGLPLTLLITIVSFAIGAVLGIPLVLGLRTVVAPVRWLSRLAVDLLRGVPMIVWLFVLKFGLSTPAFRLSSLEAAIFGLGLISAGYLAEIYRGGIQSVPRGQFEASQALGIAGPISFLRIIAPQAARIVSPSIATYLIGLLKNSSIASTIVVSEMVFQAQSYARQNPTIAGILPYAIAGLLYIVLSVPVAMFSRILDERLRKAVI